VHAGDGAGEVVEIDLGVSGDGPRPVGDGGSEAGDLQAGYRKRGTHGVEGVVGDGGYVFSVDQTQFEVFPTEFAVGFDLGLDIASGFVGDSGKIHVLFLAASRFERGRVSCGRRMLEAQPYRLADNMFKVAPLNTDDDFVVFFGADAGI
jgi:hypothetical protein